MKYKKPVLKLDQTDVPEKNLVYKIGRTIYFFGDVSADSACEVIKHVDELEREAKNKPITVKINSAGGNEYDGLAIYDRLRSCECEIITIGTGIVASMAVIILLAGDVRYLSETCTVMNHQGSEEIEGRVADLKISINETDAMENLIVDLVAERIGQSASKVRNDIKLGDQYLRAHQAVEEGYAHELLMNRKTRRRRKRT